jgi:hypothetical protein
VSYGAPIHGIGSDGEYGGVPLELRWRTPEDRARYLDEKRAELLAAGKLDEVETMDAVRSVMDGETLAEFEHRKGQAVLSYATLSAVAAEALRAHLKHRAGGGSLLEGRMSDTQRLAALVEEVGEVAREMTYDGSKGVEHQIKELVQTASVALTWAERLCRIQEGNEPA